MSKQLGNQNFFEFLFGDQRKAVKKLFQMLYESPNSQLIENLVEQLVAEKPYPTLKIINQQKHNYHVTRGTRNAFQRLLNENENKTSLKLISFLVDIPLNDLNSASLQEKLFESLEKYLYLHYFALVSHADSNLLNLFIKFVTVSKGLQNLPSKAFIITHAIDYKHHFISNFSEKFTYLQNVHEFSLKINLIILKLAHMFLSSSQTIIELEKTTKLLEIFTNTNDQSIEIGEVQQVFFNDFQRILTLINFYKNCPDCIQNIQIDRLLKSVSVLRLICDYEIKGKFEEITHLMISIYGFHLGNFQYEVECESFAFYSALSIIFELITKNNLKKNHISEKIQLLNVIFRNIRSVEVLCSLIEDIFQIFFIRREQYSSDDTVIITEYPSIPALKKFYGFLCRGSVLHNLIVFLKKFVMKKLHSENYKFASECVQLRMQNLMDIITEACWKYSILEKFEKISIGCRGHNKVLDSEDLIYLLQLHKNCIEKSSSDDESQNYYNYSSLSRRKAGKKRRHASLQNDSNLKFVECHSSNEQLLRKNINNEILRNLETSIIPKILCSPENLILIGLGLKSVIITKEIINVLNVRNVDLDTELLLIESQLQIKEKLFTINNNYQLQDVRNNINQEQPKATIEQIKTVAAKGFDLSKIINVIDHFAQSHKIQQKTELKHLLIKHCNNYTFLSQFREQDLNAVLITDLILNIPFNYDITTNILMVIKRQQQIASGIVSNLNEDGGNKIQIGVMSLLENLCECMQLLDDIYLNQLMSDNYYSVQYRKLEIEITRERAFQCIFYSMTSLKFERCDNLLANESQFHLFYSKCNYIGRFNVYLLHLTKLLQLCDNNFDQNINELLEIDVCNIIGNLIFERSFTPMEIEANVSALNLNLTHVISINICPEIVGRKINQTVLSQKKEMVLNYISNQNQILAFLLQVLKDNLFKVSNDCKTINSSYLQRFLQLPHIKKLAQCYDGNKFISIFQPNTFKINEIKKLQSNAERLEILLYESDVQDSGNEISNEIDKVVCQLLLENGFNVIHAVHISDIILKSKLIIEKFTNIASTTIANGLIKYILQHKNAVTQLSNDLNLQLKNILNDITIYFKVSKIFQFKSWPDAYNFGLKTPNTIFEKLLQLKYYKLCYDWCIIVKLSKNFLHSKQSFFISLSEELLKIKECAEVEFESISYLLRILETFPVEDCVDFLNSHKDKFRSIKLLNYAIEYLCKNSSNCEGMRNYKISLIIFKQLTQHESDHFWNLVKFPLLIIEQMIMNTKFEMLNKILIPVRKTLQKDFSSNHMEMCPYCFERSGNLYDFHASASNSSQKTMFHFGIDPKNSAQSAFILFSFNMYKMDHLIRNECIDLLLRIYASKALDYHISDANSSVESSSQCTEMRTSLDSLCGTFQVPKAAPARNEWVKDGETTHCMCCKRVVFTMLMRRHHCRRCGRVVCFTCSTHRMQIPELYADVEVRICNDCYEYIHEIQSNFKNVQNNTNMANKARINTIKWKLSGNITHDKLLREEFCYEHAPSVALCLSILGYHLDQQKCVELLLYQYRKLEKLIVPNPEVDYELVAKMINCLAIAAKVRGGNDALETIREHSEVIMSVVQNGCEAFITPGKINSNKLRRLGDSLIKAENWKLALEVHLKCGFSTAGVMAAHGLSCLRAGCFETAREKFSHCMIKLSDENLNTKIFKYIVSSNMAEFNDNHNINDNKFENIFPQIKRPKNGPPLLQEILNVIENTRFVNPQPETLYRVNVIRNSNSSLVSLFSRRKDTYCVPLHEPAINVLTTLANLKQISKGNYIEGSSELLSKKSKRKNYGFEECIFYVFSYGSHTDILKFLMRHQEILAALKYVLIQKLDGDIFIKNVFLVCLRCGRVSVLIENMLKFDGRLQIWRNIMLQTCRYLETHNLLNSLYQLQILLKDPIRASITCVRFYSMNCETFQQLHANAQHLRTAYSHLQAELEISQWEKVNLDNVTVKKVGASVSRRSSIVSTTSSLGSFLSLSMQMDAKSLNCHLNTILKQMEVAKFLANCEMSKAANENCSTKDNILKEISMEFENSSIPTLFGSVQEKIQICVLILICGKNIEEGFGLAYRIIEDYKLSQKKIFAAAAKYLSRNRRLIDVEKLLNCVKSNNGHNSRDFDDIIMVAINSACNSNEPEVRTILDNLAKNIENIELRIMSYIFIGQLTSAYLLANRYERLADIRKILRQAELTHQLHIKKLCEKKLNLK